MKPFCIMPNGFTGVSVFISCVRGKEAPPKGDFVALQGCAEKDKNIFNSN